MRIAFFVARFPLLSETFVIRQIAGLVAAGHDVAILAGRRGDAACPHDAYLRFDLESRIRLIRPADASGWQWLGRAARCALRALARPRWRPLHAALAAFMHGSRGSFGDICWSACRGHLGTYDAIVAHFGPAGVRAMHLQRAGLLAGPLAVVFHGGDMSQRARVRRHMRDYRRLFGHAAALLPVSELWRRRLLEWGAPPERVEVLRMGVDLDRLPVMDPHRVLHSPLRVLTVARLVEKKGLGYALDGVMRARLPVRYRIIGSGPQQPMLQDRARAAPPDKQIVFCGRQSQQQVFAALEEADVFLLPSVTAATGDMEGIPVAIMEAMAMGVLVVATSHSGIPELITDQRSGWLVPERDADAIAAVLSSCALPTGQLAQMRRTARAAVALQFDNAKLDLQLAALCVRLRDR